MSSVIPRNQIESASALFELFESSLDTTSSAAMFQSSTAPMNVTQHFMDSKPRQQVLGESVFNQFVKSQELQSEFPLGLDKIEVPELSPSVGTVTPLQLHSSIVESIFSPSIENSSPMFEDVELDSENWTSLFEPNELEVPSMAVKEEIPAVATIPAVVANESRESSATPQPTFKRSSSEAELDLSSRSNSKKRSVSPDGKDHLGVVAYNRKQRSTPLSPIVVESDDPIAQKRARNTEAARRSRARKMDRMNQLEEKVESLSSRNQELEDEVARLRAMLAQR